MKITRNGVIKEEMLELPPPDEEFDQFVDWLNKADDDDSLKALASTSSEAPPAVDNRLNDPSDADSSFSFSGLYIEPNPFPDSYPQPQSSFHLSMPLLNVNRTDGRPLLNSCQRFQRRKHMIRERRSQHRKPLIDKSNTHSTPETSKTSMKPKGIAEDITEAELKDRIQIELISDLWEKLAKLTNEMKISKRGNHLFPKLAFNVTGLEKDNLYHFHVTFRRNGRFRYRFVDGSWTEYIPAAPEYANDPVPHPNNIQCPKGSDWMKQEVLFDVKVANYPDVLHSSVILRSFHKYIPVVMVSRFDPITETFVPFIEKLFPVAEFITVSKYYNRKVAELKIDTHPKTLWLRESRKRCHVDEKMAPEEGNQNESPLNSSMFNFSNTSFVPPHEPFSVSSGSVAMPMVLDHTYAKQPDQSIYFEENYFDDGFGSSAPVFYPGKC